MLIKILIVLALLIAIFLIVAAFQPSSFRVERSATIAAPPAEIFPRVNDLHRFQEWSPWAKLDPNCQTSFEGPTAGTGAIFNWSGNHQVGQGRMTIIENQPDQLVRLKLDFMKPFAGTNIAEFHFTPQAGQTLVTWSMTGQKAFPVKAMGLFMSMDKMIGTSFEQGLSSLRALSEAAAKTAPGSGA